MWKARYVIGGAAVGAMLACATVAQAQDKAKIAAGENLYVTYCSTCHGEGMTNTNATTFDLRRLTADDRARFDNSVTNGKNQMPPWKGVLDHEQLELIWNFIRDNAYQK